MDGHTKLEFAMHVDSERDALNLLIYLGKLILCLM